VEKRAMATRVKPKNLEMLGSIKRYCKSYAVPPNLFYYTISTGGANFTFGVTI
jgi:hypothetical protein